MDDQEFLAAFEATTLSPDSFRHADHVRLAWVLLRASPPLAALDRFSRGLRRFAASLGKPERYHETVTWAYLLLINERMERTGRDAPFEVFAARHRDLFDGAPPFGILATYYREETLRSDLARATYLLPDQLAGDPAAGSD